MQESKGKGVHVVPLPAKSPELSFSIMECN